MLPLSSVPRMPSSRRRVVIWLVCAVWATCCGRCQSTLGVRCEEGGVFTCAFEPAIQWRKPLEANRGKAGISCCCGMVWRSCSDVDLPGKMLVDCYLNEDSCICCVKGEEEEKRKTYGGSVRWEWRAPLPPRSTLPRHLPPNGDRCRGCRSCIGTLLVEGRQEWSEVSGSHGRRAGQARSPGTGT